jgi:hypothetical protein
MKFDSISPQKHHKTPIIKESPKQEAAAATTTQRRNRRRSNEIMWNERCSSHSTGDLLQWLQQPNDISRFFLRLLLQQFHTIAFRKKSDSRPQTSTFQKTMGVEFLYGPFFHAVVVVALLFSHEFKRQETAKKSISVIALSKSK